MVWRITVALSTIIGLAMTFPAGAQQPAKFRVGIAAPTINMLPLWVGQDAGLFAAQGLDVEIVNMEGGSRGLIALGNGELQAHNVGLSAVVEANGKGNDLRLIAASANSMQFGFFGAKDIRSAADLAGRTVGVSAFASESDVAATLALKQLGLARSAVTVVESGATLRRLDALQSGVLQATPLNAPADLMAERAGLPRLVDLAASTPWIFNGLVVSRAALAGQRDLFRRFLMAYVEAADLALADEKRAKDVLARQFKTSSADVIAASYADFRRLMPSDGRPSRQGAENVIAELPGIGTRVVSSKVEDYVDWSLIDELQKNGFLAAMKQKYALP